MAPTTPHTRRRNLTAGVGAAAIAMLLAACNGGDPTTETTDTPEPTLTAPTTLTPDQQAEADVEETFRETIQRLDTFYANASDYADAELGWNIPLVEDELRMRGDAAVDFENSTTQYVASGIEMVGETKIDTFDVTAVELDDTSVGTATATATACLDQSSLTYQTYDGQPAEDFIPTRSQGWVLTWDLRYDLAEADGGGAYITSVDITPDQPC